tara:strand:- start:143 stop:637 length:495 start_codon:yes stop_codon:yes gene_type:complete
MGIETAVAAAAISAGANLIGNKMTNTAQKKAAAEANQIAQAKTTAGLGYLEPAYNKGMDAQQRAYEQSLALQGQTFRPTIDAMQGGNLAAQRQILAGLPMQRAAILGGKIDYSQLQPYQQNIDTSAMQGLFNPQAMQFRPQQAPQEQMSPEMIAYMNSMQNGGY